MKLSDNSPREYLAWDDQIVINFDEMNLGREYVEKYSDAGSIKGVRSQDFENIVVVYEN